MGISDRLLGKKNVNGHPHIEAVHPSAALPGGEVRIVGKSLRPHELRRPQVRFGDVEGAVVISSDDFLVARVPPARLPDRSSFRPTAPPAIRIRSKSPPRLRRTCIR